MLGQFLYENQEIDKVLGTDGLVLYPHQQEAIQNFRSGSDIIVSVPTAAGKTLIATVAITDSYLKGLKSIYIVPLRALASEIYANLSRLRLIGARVGIATGDYNEGYTRLSRFDVIVMTSEKADSLLHHEPEFLSEIGLIVADEMHLLGDSDRGSRLEVFMTAARLVNPDIRFVGLSATISNADQLCGWLKCKLTKSNFRPVPIESFTIFRNRVEGESGSEALKNPLAEISKSHILDGGQVLIFRNSRKRAEETAIELSRELDLTGPELPVEADERTSKESLLFELISKGVAFHHAGLSNENRQLVEDYFRNGKIKAICATPTLAAGVNLPARAVILRDLTRFSDGYSQFISIMEAKQMMGRAGRPTYDTKGYCYLWASSDQSYGMCRKYIEDEPEDIRSSLSEVRLLRFNNLALISSGIAHNAETLMDFYSRTFMGYSGDMPARQSVDESLDFLETNDFIRSGSAGLKATDFGRKVSNLYIDPMSALAFKNFLEEEFSVFGALYCMSSVPDMPPVSVQKQDYPLLDDAGDRLYTDRIDLPALKLALIMKDWIDEVPINTISEKYSVGSGDIQSRVATAEWLLFSMAELSSIYRKQVRDEIMNLSLRIRDGVRQDVIDLLRIREVGRVRARRLYNAGYHSVREVGEARVSDLAKLRNFSDRLAETVISNARLISGDSR